MSDLIFVHHRSGVNDYRDLVAAGAITPGMVVNHLTKVVLVASGDADHAIFVADKRTGYADDTAYASGDSGQMRRLGPGDTFRGILKSGQSVAAGDVLTVENGLLIAWTDYATHGHGKLHAVEAVNASGGNARIIVEVP